MPQWSEWPTICVRQAFLCAPFVDSLHAHIDHLTHWPSATNLTNQNRHHSIVIQIWLTKADNQKQPTKHNASNWENSISPQNIQHKEQFYSKATTMNDLMAIWLLYGMTITTLDAIIKKYKFANQIISICKQKWHGLDKKTKMVWKAFLHLLNHHASPFLQIWEESTGMWQCN